MPAQRHQGPLRGRLVAVLTAGALLALAVFGPRAYALLRYGQGERATADLAPRPVAIVLGAGVYPDGEPSPVLQDRVLTAAELFRAGKVERLLMSGDGREVALEETAAMRRFAVAHGVPDASIIEDPHGYRTRETCERARTDFGVTRAYVVTHTFHLPRSLMLCDHAGIDAAGVPADRQTYPLSLRLKWQARETAATAAAVLEIWRLR